MGRRKSEGRKNLMTRTSKWRRNRLREVRKNGLRRNEEDEEETELRGRESDVKKRKREENASEKVMSSSKRARG